MMMVWRFLLGLAFGAGIPNLYALVGDIVPKRRRSFNMTLLTTAASIGGIAGGLMAPVLSENFGWQGIFLAGGIVPLALAPLSAFLLRESPNVLAARGRRDELASVLADFGISNKSLPETNGRHVPSASQPLDLVRNGLFLISLLYMLVWLMNGISYYILTNWLPSLLMTANWSSTAAQRSLTLLYAGGVAGGLALSWMMDLSRRHGLLVPAASFMISAILLVACSYWMTSPAIYPLLIGLGATIGGGQYIMAAVAARLYPPNLLATSISWVGALARIGAICGPLIGGWMLLSGWSTGRIMMALSCVPLICALLFAAIAFATNRREQTDIIC
jgi:AAHS family 4-hydroxybenzoate transporter-like MFS transporter